MEKYEISEIIICRTYKTIEKAWIIFLISFVKLFVSLSRLQKNRERIILQKKFDDDLETLID